MEALPANIGIFYTFGFPLCSFVICAFFRNSALTDIKEVGIKPQFYPRHYIAPARWMRNVFGLQAPVILKFEYFEFMLALFYAIYGIVSGIVLTACRYNMLVIACLFYFEEFSVLFFELIVIVLSIFYRRKHGKQSSASSNAASTAPKPMVRFFFYPQWNYKKAEQWLEEMEHGGFRLSKVSWCWWFHFVPSRPKDVQYLFTYNYIKETAMLDCEDQLRSRCGANCIPFSGLLYATVYRETAGNDLSEIVRFRQHYLKHVFRQKLLLSLLFSVLAAAILVLSLRDGAPRLGEVLWWGMASLVGVLFDFWYLYGLFRVKSHKEV